MTLDACTGRSSSVRDMERGPGQPPGSLGGMGTTRGGGGFHVKAGLLELGRPYFAAKVKRKTCRRIVRDSGLPNIQGVIVLCDAGNGNSPLAVDGLFVE